MNTPESNVASDLVCAALVQCQGKVKPAEFDATNPFFKSKYATLGAIIEASRGALLDSGLAILQKPTINGNLVSVQTVIIHKSGQWLDGGTMSLALEENERNSDAQLAGSIITYLKRYAWASVLGIYADQDTDGNDAPKGATPRQQPKPAQSQAQPVTTPPSKPSEPVIGPKYRLQTLNKLQAAPGGKMRPVFHQYATVQGWILPTEEPEDWPFDKIPTTPEQFLALGEALHAFERQQREQATA